VIKVIQGLLLQIFLFMRDLSPSACGQLQYGSACQLIPFLAKLGEGNTEPNS